MWRLESLRFNLTLTVRLILIFNTYPAHHWAIWSFGSSLSVRTMDGGWFDLVFLLHSPTYFRLVLRLRISSQLALKLEGMQFIGRFPILEVFKENPSSKFSSVESLWRPCPWMNSIMQWWHNFKILSWCRQAQLWSDTSHRQYR